MVINFSKNKCAVGFSIFMSLVVLTGCERQADKISPNKPQAVQNDLTATLNDPTPAQNEQRACVEQFKAIQPAQRAQAIARGTLDIWQPCFDHSEALLIEVLNRIELLSNAEKNNTSQKSENHRSASQQQKVEETLANLLYFLRAYSYFGDLEKLDNSSWLKLAKTLEQLAKSPLVLGSDDTVLRLQEHLLVALYQFLPNEHGKEVLSAHLEQNGQTYQQLIVALFAHFNNVVSGKINEGEYFGDNKTGEEQALNGYPISEQAQYTLLELYRTVGFLAYQARSDDSLKEILATESVINAISTHLNQLSIADWLLNNSLWVLANIHVLLNEQQLNEQKIALDNLVESHLFALPSISEEQKRTLFSQYYLANSLRTTDHCNDEFAGKCEIKTVNQVLPIDHQCSSSLVIRAFEMTANQLNDSCEQLIAQEDFFHTTLGTNRKPVADDLNTQLRVIIFNNYSQYNQHGQLTFNIFTNNGGMYIEGEPNIEGNQATFYSFEAFWLQPEFSVWNLEHEYVHYLDGRFVKYGGFGHFPDSLVWWTEGIAEYISKKFDNPKAVALLKDTPIDEWPTLTDIFSTTYADGTDRVYRWSYLAQRFIFGFHTQQGQALANFLKDNDFEGYKSALSTYAKNHQLAFNTWLKSLLAHEEVNNESSESSESSESNEGNKASNKASNNTEQSIDENSINKPKYLYRYLYRDYLRPSHLPITPKHQHYSNWG